MNKIQKFLSVVFFIAIFVVLIYLIQNYGIEPLRNKIESMGIWAPFGIFILRGVSIILPALPSSAYSLLAGSLLGFQTGYITIVFSDMVFCQTAFFIARNFGRGPVSNLVGPKAMQKIESFNQNQLEENFFLMTGLLMTGLFDLGINLLNILTDPSSFLFILCLSHNCSPYSLLGTPTHS